jgi:hypothetical protein
VSVKARFGYFQIHRGSDFTMANLIQSLFSNSVKKRLILSFALILLIPGLAIGGFSYLTAKSTVDVQMLQTANENVNLLNSTITKFIQPQIDNIKYGLLQRLNCDPNCGQLNKRSFA